MNEPKAPGDHFSDVSAGYATYRPRYPRELFEFVASIAPGRGRAWDCGAGTGQATVDLAEWFDEVIGTDVSAEQIAQAPENAKVVWQVAPAEAVSIVEGTVDAVTVAQALHWFDQERFYDEVRRVARPEAVIAAWTYGSPEMEGPVGQALRTFERTTLADYWPAERQHIVDQYQTIPFPFERIAAPPMVLEESWNAQQLLGYLRTWSATARYVKEHETDPVADFELLLGPLWEDVAWPRKIRWPLVVLAGRVS